MKTYYSCHGLVLGLDWGFGQSAYPAEELISDSLEGLKADIEAGIKDGSLDSGMGFQKLIGAFMIIETKRGIVYNVKCYYNKTTKRYYTKGLTPKQKWFLSHCEY